MKVLARGGHVHKTNTQHTNSMLEASMKDSFKKKVKPLRYLKYSNLVLFTEMFISHCVFIGYLCNDRLDICN